MPYLNINTIATPYVYIPYWVQQQHKQCVGCDEQAVLFLGPGEMVQTLLLCLHLTSAVYNAVTIIAL